MHDINPLEEEEEIGMDMGSMGGLMGAAIWVMPLAWLIGYRWLQRNRPVKGWPVIGASLEILANYHRIYDWIVGLYSATSSRTIRVPLPISDYVITTDPACVQHILKTNFANYPKGPFMHQKLAELLGDGIFNSDGELWRIQRKTASFEFASRVLRDFSSEVFRDYALQLSRIIDAAASSSTPVDLQELLLRMTLDSISKVGFGVNIGSLSPMSINNGFATAFNMSNAIIAYRFADPLWKIKRWFNIGRERLLKTHIKVLDDFTYKIIRTRKDSMKVEKFSDVKPDILSRFISLDKQTEDKILRDVVLNFVIAGRDTTASSLSWFFYMLALHPRVSTRIYEELLEVETEHWETKSSRVNRSMEDFVAILMYDTVTKMDYLHAAITEAIRLHPPVPLDFKGVIHDDTLPDGTFLTKNDLVIYSPYVMARMPFIWGEDACEYNPERWIQDGKFRNASPFEFTAFQAGPRTCLGKDSAYLQMKIVAALLCRFFTFELVSRQHVKYSVNITMAMANGLWVIPRKRK